MGGETLTDRPGIPSLFAVTIALLVLASSFAATRPAAAQPVYPTVALEVVRIAQVDEIDVPPLGDWDWYYWLGLWDGTAYAWTLYDAPNGINVTVGAVHGVEARTPILSFAFVLCEGDTATADDVADIGSTFGGGADDTDCPVGALLPVGAYRGTWDLRTDAIGGDAVVVDAEGFRASGDIDGSTGSDENDANLWFRVSDGYARPTASAGPDHEGWLNDSFVFDGRASTATNASLESYEWDFDDDGATDATGPMVTWRFSAKGAHTVSLTVADSLGEEAGDEAVVTIRNRSPEARFVYLPAEPETGEPAQFADASADPDGAIASWSWNFGDGGTSPDRDPTHVYDRAGAYAVRLTVTDDDGGTNTTTRTVTVHAPPDTGALAVVAVVLLVLAAIAVLALARWFRKHPPTDI